MEYSRYVPAKNGTLVCMFQVCSVLWRIGNFVFATVQVHDSSSHCRQRIFTTTVVSVVLQLFAVRHDVSFCVDHRHVPVVLTIFFFGVVFQLNVERCRKCMDQFLDSVWIVVPSSWQQREEKLLSELVHSGRGWVEAYLSSNKDHIGWSMYPHRFHKCEVHY